MEQSFSSNCEAGVEHKFLFDTHSEVADALHGFLDPVDSPLLPLDTLFQKDLDSLICSSSFPPSSLNGQDGGDSLPLQSFSDALFQNDMDSLICSSSLPSSSSLIDEDGSNFLPFPSFSDSAIFSLPAPHSSDNSFPLHHCPKRLCSSSDLYIQAQPPPLFEQRPFYYPIVDPTVFTEFEAPPPPLFEQSQFYYPIVDPTVFTEFEAPPPPLFEQSPFYYPIVDPTVFTEFEAPPPPTMAVVAPFANYGSRLSVQSVAARERRKRISEKTQELGRLIPAGHKMNTAEMLQASLKYVKFLQAQLDVLRLMDSIPCKSAQDEHLQVLLASSAIQERLSTEGMCIVPKEMVEELAADPELKSRPLISRSMDQFIDSILKMDDSK